MQMNCCRKLFVFFWLALGCLLIFGCNDEQMTVSRANNARKNSGIVEEDKPTKQRIAEIRQAIENDQFPFSLGFYVGSYFEGGFWSVQIKHDGSCLIIGQPFARELRGDKEANNEWLYKSYRLDLSQDELASIRHKLKQIDLAPLAATNYNKNILDGEQRVVIFESNHVRKYVYCSNYFPEAIEKLNEYMYEYFFEKYKDKLVESTQFITNGESLAPEK
ncbi:hypothetical protein JD969_14210 [Planctomycetota bacterium]|nr:hypothetical protein JD969_14210 [Planctomycetota bacterium]